MWQQTIPHRRRGRLHFWVTNNHRREKKGFIYFQNNYFPRPEKPDVLRVCLWCWDPAAVLSVWIRAADTWVPRPTVGPLTLIFDWATGPFLKINMRHGVYWHEKEYHRNDMNLFVNSTGDIRLFWNRHESCKNNDRGHCHFLKSICDFRDPPIKDPYCGWGMALFTEGSNNAQTEAHLVNRQTNLYI